MPHDRQADPGSRGTLEIVVQRVGDTDATDALVRVFYKIHLLGPRPGDPELRPVISEFDIVPLLDGAETITRPFEIARENVEFFRVELFRAIGREDHRLEAP